jgi:hypothetical protein
MITKFKIYESLNDGEPEKGDYVIVNVNDKNYSKHIVDEVNSNIFRLIDIIYQENHITYVIDYLERWLISRKEIIYWTKDKKDLELTLKANKFNI